MSNNAKKNTLKHPENTNKACFEAFWEILENPVIGSKMWFSAQISNYAKIPRNTQKTPLNMFWGFLRNFWKSGSRLKIRFSAQMSNNAKKNTLKHPENTNKACFEAFWEILENPVIGSKMWFSAQISNYAKIPQNTQKTPLNMFWGFLRNFWKSGSRLKIRFSAQMSNNAKNTLKNSENTN